MVSRRHSARLRDGSPPSDQEDQDLHDRPRWLAQTSGRHRRDRTRVVTGWAKDRLPGAVRHPPRHSGRQGRYARGEQLWCDRALSSSNVVARRDEARVRDQGWRLRDGREWQRSSPRELAQHHGLDQRRPGTALFRDAPRGGQSLRRFVARLRQVPQSSSYIPAHLGRLATSRSRSECGSIGLEEAADG